MGHRLSKIYTRTGDAGTSAMADGKRLSKADAVFAAMGDVDELNSHIGLARCVLNDLTQKQTAKPPILPIKNGAQALKIMQHLLFNLGGELAMPSHMGINDTHVEWLEQQIDGMNQHLPPLKDFILPTGNRLTCQLHICRSVCRRAERQLVKLSDQNADAINKPALKFINRLSDYFFVAARYSAQVHSQVAPQDFEMTETLWDASVLKGFK